MAVSRRAECPKCYIYIIRDVVPLPEANVQLEILRASCGTGFVRSQWNLLLETCNVGSNLYGAALGDEKEVCHYEEDDVANWVILQ